MNKADRLYELLPSIYRMVDTEEGYSLQALLQVIAEQVNIVEEDIKHLYDNWFIETCDDWVVPYIGELIGFQPVHEAGEPGDPRIAQGHARNKILIPRREVANVISYRRRKGTLALLELLANNVAGWPARAVEFYKQLGWTQHLNHPRVRRGQPANLGAGEKLDLLDSPFGKTTHTVDVRRLNSHRTTGRFNIGSVGLFVWRLKTYSVTQTPAYCIEEEGPECYTFNALGHDTPLYNVAQPETSPTHIADVLNLPTPIRRRPFEDHTDKKRPSKPRHASADYYDDSLSLWLLERDSKQQMQKIPIPRESVIPANLSDWHRFRPARGFVAVDPVLGRIVFPSNQKPKRGIVVSYHYAFSADIGGGEYERPLSEPAGAQIFRVGEKENLKTIAAALEAWRKPDPSERARAAVIELQDSGVYTEQISINLDPGEYLQLRAAQRKRPVLRLLDYQSSLPDALSIQGRKGSRFTLDGLTIGGRGIQINGQEISSEDFDSPAASSDDDLCDVTIRHCTLVPGWSLECDCEPRRPNDPSIKLEYSVARIRIEHSIVGSITTEARERASEPQQIQITDSIVDATSEERIALGSSRGAVSYVALTIARSTVIGRVQTHSIELAENTIFNGVVTVGRRGTGCVRFCYVPDESRTPRRYECEPDLVKQAVVENADVPAEEKEAVMEQESDRVRPVFNSLRYGTPSYCQLAERCAEEITRGADDESEMGVFHDLFQPQRAANLRARLDEFTPAGMDAGIVYAN